MYTLHIGNKNYSSWSLRPWALMSELGIPFEEVNHVFGAGFARSVAGKSPTARVPVLHDGKRVVWDSLAIVMQDRDTVGGRLAGDRAREARSEDVVHLLEGKAQLGHQRPGAQRPGRVVLVADVQGVHGAILRPARAGGNGNILATL